ncbi:MAG: glutamate formimidoyltransferase, partial [Acidobacteriota bacterium]
MVLLESVPNVSEGRRAQVIESCADAIRASGAWLLDVSSDPSHNRTVFSIAGAPATVQDAVLSLFQCALPQIDLRAHDGVHPRIGAIDVVPFIPLDGATMDDAVAAATAAGAEVARRFALPVFLYGAAAASAGRARLEEIRRGQFEGLAAKLRQPEWRPDFGPSQPHPSAGATVIGAREALVAYNVNLATDRLDIAKAIAATVRERSGGLPFVKALGLALPHRGIVQVSMNLTNFRATSIRQAFDAVASAATRRGVAVLESEIVGLQRQN